MPWRWARMMSGVTMSTSIEKVNGNQPHNVPVLVPRPHGLEFCAVWQRFRHFDLRIRNGGRVFGQQRPDVESGDHLPFQYTAFGQSVRRVRSYLVSVISD